VTVMSAKAMVVMATRPITAETRSFFMMFP
jgi:hypothetical protein